MGSNALKEIYDRVKKCDAIRDYLKTEVIGQDAAVDAVMDSITESFVFDRTNGELPLGVFLFAGTPGVGKTFLATKCAELMGCEYRTYNMSAYNTRESGVITLFGLDAGYKGGREGELVRYVDNNNYYISEKGGIDKTDADGKPVRKCDKNGKPMPCVIIMDEIEKADISVIMQLLQIIGSGKCENTYVMSAKRMTPNERFEKGIPESITLRDTYTSFSNVYLFLTTNAGRSLYENGKQPTADLTKDKIIDAIRKDINPQTKQPYFPDAILSRMQTGVVAMFRHLSTVELIKIAANELDRNIKLLNNQFGLEIDFDPIILQLLLLKEGGRVDARNFRAIASDFLSYQISTLTRTLEESYLSKNKIHIGIEKKDLEYLDILMYGEPEKRSKQSVLLVCEDSEYLHEFYDMFEDAKGCRDDINIISTDKYSEAFDIVKVQKEAFVTPVIFVVIPSMQDENSKTFAANKSAVSTRVMKGFTDYVREAKAYDERIAIYAIAPEVISGETKRDLMRCGVTDILPVDDDGLINKKIIDLLDSTRINSMAFDFERKGKALRYDVVYKPSGNTINIIFRAFEKNDNIKSDDEDFFIGKDRMPNISFSNVIGGDNIKNEAADFISFLRNPAIFVGKGLKPPKGLLFYGPPGTGKTFMAKAIAHEAGVPFISANGGSILTGYTDKNNRKLSGSETLKKYFEIARKYAPSILFIDEIDAIALDRQGGYADSIVNTLLSEMDGFDGHAGNPVVLIGATNAGISSSEPGDGRILDPAVVRRFTRKFNVALPEKEDRRAHIEKELEAFRVEEGFNLDRDLETAAQLSQGLSFGKLSNAIEIAKRTAVRDNDRPLRKEDIDCAIETELFGDAHEKSPEYMCRTAWHEAGHLCVRCLTGDAPDYATIISRGRFGGYVLTARDEKNQTMTKTDYENRIKICLAGRCAEVIHYGPKDGLSFGPSQDIATAYNIISAMLRELGMDDEIGITYIPEGTSGADAEVQKRIDALFRTYYEQTMDLLNDNFAVLEDLANALYDRKSLSRTDSEEILKKHGLR